MRARIRRWGNSLALRIPKAFAEEASLEDESVVDLKVVNGKLVVASVVEPEIRHAAVEMTQPCGVRRLRRKARSKT